MKKILLLIIIFLFSSFFIKASAAEQPSVVINEISWMGTTVSANSEWLELKNNTNQDIIIDGWTLRAADGIPEIKLSGVIFANSFYLIERTDDNTVLNVKADLIYKGALGNNGEDLWLYDGNNNLIDEVNCSLKWFAGDNTTKQTMEKFLNGWQNSKDAGGTPKSQNSSNTTKEISDKTDLIPAATYITGIVFSEILPSPDGADEEMEWIEFYNTNDFEVDLSGWQIKDGEGSPTSYFLPKNTKIMPYGYLVLKRPDTKITLNNAKDGLTLYSASKEIISYLNYESAPINQSYNKIGENWQWSALLTPGEDNKIGQNSVLQKTASTSQLKEGGLPKTEKSGIGKKVNSGLAAISKTTNQNPWFLLLIALIITIIFAMIVLFVKFKFLKLNSK